MTDPDPHTTAEPPRAAKLPAFALAAVLTLLWAAHVPFGGMAGWGVSAAALAQGRVDTLLLHLFAHGSLLHVGLNATALVAVAPPLVARLGESPGAWLRCALLFGASGLAGATLYLLLHPTGATPMLGASGAIYGLVALLVRLPPADHGPPLPLRSPEMRGAALTFVRDNLFLFVLLALAPGQGGLAWEAHLGGALLGLLLGPRFLPPRVAKP